MTGLGRQEKPPALCVTKCEVGTAHREAKRARGDRVGSGTGYERQHFLDPRPALARWARLKRAWRGEWGEVQSGASTA